jgi:hypothetical protein
MIIGCRKWCFSLLVAASTASFARAGEPQVSFLDIPGAGAVPDATVGDDGTVHVAWVAGENVFYARSRDGGKSLEPPLRVNSEPDSSHPPNTHRGPEIEVDATGTVHAIWFLNGYQRKLPPEQWGVAYARLKPGQQSFEPARNLSRRPSEGFSLGVGPNRAVAVLFLADGAWTVVSSDGGDSFGTPELVPDIKPCPCCATRAVFDSSGGLHLFLRLDRGTAKENQRDMYLVSRRGDGPWTPRLISDRPWQIAACPMAGASCERSGNALVLAWETQNDLGFVRLDSPPEIQKPRVTTAAGVGGKYPVSLAARDGLACLTWKRGAEVHWQVFEPDGHPRGPERSRPSENALRHAAVALPDGRFLVVD